MNAKLHKSNKPRYISKAERAKLELQEQEAQQVESSDNVDNATAADDQQA